MNMDNDTNWGSFANIKLNETYATEPTPAPQAYQALPEGIYTVTIDRLWVHMSKKGLPMLTALFVVENPSDMAGRKEYMNKVLLRGDKKDGFRVSMALRALHEFFPDERLRFTDIASFAESIDTLLDKYLGYRYTIAIDDSTNFREYHVAEIFGTQSQPEETTQFSQPAQGNYDPFFHERPVEQAQPQNSYGFGNPDTDPSHFDSPF